ncbi:RING finger protein 224 [Polyodon spathula]|uniref:RING finger protein 224 n=1 Tax=Polyodon spathula TaxID=7913 RepID=UPI001B7F174D|nr:RING finger protein 224 [Polyodon spathula]
MSEEADLGEVPDPSPDGSLDPRASRKLDCIICYSSFNLRERLPRKLHCGHTFCQDCLRRLDTVLNEQRWIPCPQCRQNTPCPRGGAGTLDLDLSAFLAAKTQAETRKTSTRPTGAEPHSKAPSGKQQPISEQPSVWSLELPSEPRFPRSPCCCCCCRWWV